jgi:hypothetical protein
VKLPSLWRNAHSDATREELILSVELFESIDNNRSTRLLNLPTKKYLINNLVSLEKKAEEKVNKRDTSKKNTNFIKRVNKIKFTDSTKVIIQTFYEQVNNLEIGKLVVVVIDTKDEVKASITPVDDLHVPILEWKKIAKREQRSDRAKTGKNANLDKMCQFLGPFCNDSKRLRFQFAFFFFSSIGT